MHSNANGALYLLPTNWTIEQCASSWKNKELTLRPLDKWVAQSLIGRESFVWVEVKQLCQQMNGILTDSRNQFMQALLGPTTSKLHTHVTDKTNTHPINRRLSRTTRVSRYQKGKNRSGFH